MPRQASTRQASTRQGSTRQGSTRQTARRPGPNRHRNSAQRRRSLRGVLLVALSLGLSAGVILAWLPASSLVNQRHQLTAAGSELNSLNAQNRRLKAEAAELSQPGAVDRIAQEQYQLEPPGTQVYDVLPPNDKGAGQYSGDPGLQSLAAPEASAQGLQSTTVSGGTSTSDSAGHDPASSGATGTHGDGGTSSSSPSSFLGRIKQTLEFWH